MKKILIVFFKIIGYLMLGCITVVFTIICLPFAQLFGFGKRKKKKNDCWRNRYEWVAAYWD